MTNWRATNWRKRAALGPCIICYRPPDNYSRGVPFCVYHYDSGYEDLIVNWIDGAGREFAGVRVYQEMQRYC